MKLYLSSFRLGNDPGLLAALIGNNKRAVVIANSVDFLDKPERQTKVLAEIDALRGLGLEPEELDLRNYFDKPNELELKMADYGLLWLRGGNAFILRRAMAQSGFDNALRKLFEKDEVVYGGYSAGICVITPDMHGIDLVDDPNVVPGGYKPEIIWEGMGLVDFSIAPHYQSEHPESEMIEEVVSYFKKHDMTYRALHDGEVILVNNYEVRTV